MAHLTQLSNWHVLLQRQRWDGTRVCLYVCFAMAIVLDDLFSAFPKYSSWENL